MTSPETDSADASAEGQRLRIRALSVQALADECAEQSARFRKSESFNDFSCFELFRRAISQKDQAAWSVIHAQYQQLVAGWVCSRMDCVDHPAEDVVQDAFARFARAFTPARFNEYNQLRSIMAYLQRCAYAAACDYRRRTRTYERQILGSIDEREIETTLVSSADTVEDVVHGSIDANLVWQRVMAQCQNEADRLVARRVFVEGYKPEQIFADNPALFDNVQSVYRHIRNLRDRLRRDSIIGELIQNR